MKIANEFTVDVPIDRAWEVLTDLEGIAPCMPGAQLTGVDGDVYSGKVKIKVGPIISEYAGTARFVEKDDVNHRAVIDAKGRDSRGAGNATAAITAQLRADGARTVVTIDTDLKITGKVAQFGSGMIKEVSRKLLDQFVDCLEGSLAIPATAAGSPDGARATATRPAPPPEAAANRRTITSTDEVEPLNVMSIAGGSIYKRALPVVAALVIIAAIVVFFLVS
jgi:carbon monoxide dehydrogenase subunit G